MAEWIHADQDLMSRALELASERLGIPAHLIEKDYMVTVLLGQIATVRPDIIFKGGTSLSKCHKILSRFSEDIDLAVAVLPGRSDMRQIKKDIVSCIDACGFHLVNPEAVKSNQKLNGYRVSYPSALSVETDEIPKNIKIETSYFHPSFPYEVLAVDSYLGCFVKEEAPELMDRYDGLHSFEMRVQTLERTFIDKVFAICDYYMEGKTYRQSRHLYDIYKILARIDIDESFPSLIHDIRLLRAEDPKRCPSAMPGVVIGEKLDEIIAGDVYLEDWNTFSKVLQFDLTTYEEAIASLSKVKEMNIF